MLPVLVTNILNLFLNCTNWSTAVELFKVVPSANLTTLWHKALQVPTTLVVEYSYLYSTVVLAP